MALLPEPVPTKVCPKCGCELPATTEYFHQRRKNGRVSLRAECKQCRLKQTYDWRSRNPDKVKAVAANQRIKDKEKRRAYQRTYRRPPVQHILPEPGAMATCIHCGQVKPYTPEFFAASRAYKTGLASWCRDCANKRARGYISVKTPAGRSEMWRRSRQTAEAKRRITDYVMRRYHEDPTYRIKKVVGQAIRNALRSRKDCPAWSALPYTADELRAHLESLFEPGMTWDNYGRGGWEIDHVRPISTFSFASARDPKFQTCWALANLQPMWWHDNRVKRDSFPGSERGECVVAAQG